MSGIFDRSHSLIATDSEPRSLPTIETNATKYGELVKRIADLEKEIKWKSDKIELLERAIDEREKASLSVALDSIPDDMVRHTLHGAAYNTRNDNSA